PPEVRGQVGRHRRVEADERAIVAHRRDARSRFVHEILVNEDEVFLTIRVSLVPDPLGVDAVQDFDRGAVVTGHVVALDAYLVVVEAERHGRGDLPAERRGSVDADRPVEAGETLTLQPVELADTESAERLLLAPGARHVGKEKSFGGFRIGQFHWLQREGLAGFDRPIGINTASPLGGKITASVPFSFNNDQVGVEGYYVAGNNRASVEILNGINPEGIGDEGDTDRKK